MPKPKPLTRPGLDKGWRIGKPLPGARLESANALIDGRLYVFGGFYFRLKASKRVDVYDPTHNTWTRLKDMPSAVTHINAALDEPFVWFAGGFIGDHPGSVTREVWRYSVDSWQAGIPLPVGRAGGGLQRFGRFLHYFGGFAGDRDTTCTDHWALSLDGGTEWIKRAPLPEPLGHTSSLVLDGKIYCIGGQERHDTNPVDKTSVYAYDPDRDRWKQLASLPEPRSHFEAGTFAHNGKIVIAGGRMNQSKRRNNLNFFRHQEDRFIDDLPQRTYRFIRGRGNTDAFASDILIYDPIADTWEKVMDLPAHLLAPVAKIIQTQLVLTGGARNWATNPQSRTLLNESLLDLIPQSQPQAVLVES